MPALAGCCRWPELVLWSVCKMENATAMVAEPRPAVAAKLIRGPEAAQLCGLSYRAWLRLCDGGGAPWGLKLGGARRWNLAELEAWIADGCPRVRARGSAAGGDR